MIQTLSYILVVMLLWVMAWHIRSVKARQALLLVASYVSYSSWGIGFLCVLIISSLMNYAWGCVLRRRLTPGFLWIGIALNLLPLAFLKYLPPLLELGPAGSWEYDLARYIIMPVGMSFWTFQALSYLWDIYLDEEADPSLLEFCLYMAFWPTVVSGPVCRLPNMLPQFRQEPIFSSDNVSIGVLRVMQGLFMKMVLAQLLASGWIPGEGVTAGFDQVKGGWGGMDVWLLGIGFGFLLFFDFAGYSHMVIGTARIFGIRLPENFDRPFFSTTPTAFWNRWHMSLSFWIRDYVFRPLAATRRNRWWPHVALVISMTVFGLWHGAKWTFIIFGFYHGLLLVMHRLGQRTKQRLPIRLPHYLGMFLAWGTTFLLVSLGFILFRANDLTEALSMFRAVFSPDAYRHFAMPRSFYIVTCAVTIGYFVFTAGHSLLLSWGARYGQAIREPTQPVGAFWQVRLTNCTLIIGALFDFFRARLWWWFAPALSILAVFAGLAIYNHRADVAVTPFIYTVF
jgi:alginate O-acetyltransferase complex protein AlgI